MGKRHMTDGYFRWRDGGFAPAEITPCPYCKHFIADGVFLMHVKNCNDRKLERLNYFQKRVEIALVLFNYIPYDEKWFTNNMAPAMCYAIAFPIYKMINSYRMNSKIKHEDLMRSPSYIIEHILNMGPLIHTEPVIKIDMIMDRIRNELGVRWMSGINVGNSFMFHTNEIEDGIYSNK